MEKLSAKKNKRQMPSLSLRDISPKGRDKFGLRVKAKNLFPTSRLSLRERWHLQAND